MKYRDHRKSLSKSMSTQIEIKTIDELVQHLNNGLSIFGKEIEEIKKVFLAFCLPDVVCRCWHG